MSCSVFHSDSVLLYYTVNQRPVNFCCFHQSCFNDHHVSLPKMRHIEEVGMFVYHTFLNIFLKNDLDFWNISDRHIFRNAATCWLCISVFHHPRTPWIEPCSRWASSWQGYAWAPVTVVLSHRTQETGKVVFYSEMKPRLPDLCNIRRVSCRMCRNGTCEQDKALFHFCLQSQYRLRVMGGGPLLFFLCISGGVYFRIVLLWDMASWAEAIKSIMSEVQSCPLWHAVCTAFFRARLIHAVGTIWSLHNLLSFVLEHYCDYCVFS